MKKALLTTLTVFTSSACLWANPIDLAKAREIAQAYMCGKQAPELVESSVAKRSTTDGNAPLYIFNRGNDQGFVIVSGDDCMPAILGYTEQGDFDPEVLPPALLDWLEGQSQMISAAQEQGAEPMAVAAASGKADIAPLVTAHWSQGAPYNNLCPYRKDGGGRALTGCVATAAAQVAYYWRKELPDRTQYDTPTYSYGDAPVTESIPEGTVLQWELMQDSYGSSTPDDMETAVATLMSVIGTSTWLTYGSSTSGQISNLVNTFSGQLLMDSKCTYKSGISQSDWEDMVYSDLSKGWPIVYSGVSPTSGGHAVVVDGYRASDNLFHFNFGWGGQGDGYYTVNDLTGMNGFNEQQGMTHTIHPRTYALNGKISTVSMQTRMVNEIKVEITNNGTTDYTGVYLVLNQTGKEPESISEATARDLETIIPSGETDTLTLTYRALTPGTYYLFLMDANGSILAQSTAEATAQSPVLSLNGLTIEDAILETGEQPVIIGGEEATVIYNKVYGDATRLLASITNGEEATAATPSIQCILYRYDSSQSAFVEEDDWTESGTVFTPGDRMELAFELGALEKDVLYAAALPRTYKVGGVSMTMETYAPEDTVAYFMMSGSDLTMETADEQEAVFSGHWNKNRFLELSANTNALYYDLTRVTGIDYIPEVANPNVLYYVDDNAEIVGRNIIKNGICEMLELTAGYDFCPKEDFIANNATFNPKTTNTLWQYIVVPFDCPVPEGSRARRIGKLSNKLISESDEVNTTLKGCTPYLYRTAVPGEDRIYANVVTVSVNTKPECSDSLRGTFSNLVAGTGQRILSQNDTQTFIEARGTTIPAFSGYLEYDKDVNVSIYTYQKKDQASESLGELLGEAALLALDTEAQVPEEELEAFLNQFYEAALCYTNHSSVEEINDAAARLEESMKELRRSLIPNGEPIDVTEAYLTNPSFEESTTGWDIEKETGQLAMANNTTSLNNYMVDADGSYVLYSYSPTGKGSATISQTVTGMNNGFYRIEAWLATDEGQSVVLSANNATATMTDDGFGKRYLRKTVIDSLQVTNGTLTIGVQGNDGWYKADNFRLYYLGASGTSVAPIHGEATPTVKAYGGNGSITLQGPEGQAITVAIYTTDGRIARQVTVDGYTQVHGLAKGLYIVDRQKVIVR